MRIDFEKFDPKYKKTVEGIEAKPHIKYIRYLLSKMYSPIAIKKELQRLGLSAPHEQPLTIYYLTVMDPIIKHFGLSSLYADYKNRLLRAKSKRGEYSKNLLNYRLSLGDDLDGQVKFNKLVSFLEIDAMWCQEITKFHGSAINMPVDENGNRIIATTTSTRGNSAVEKILLFEKRYLIDKMLLENVPLERIAKYCREHLKFGVYDGDIKLYKTMFFNIQTQTIEDKIKYLQSEKNSLSTLVSDIEDGLGEYADMSMGERIALLEQTNKRIEELSDNIKGLNMLYTDAAVRVAEANEQDFENMFADIVGRAYKRFTQLDSYKDRDVVDPLFKTARMMSFAHDKVESIKAMSGKGSGNSDKHSQTVLLELYSKRIDEIVDEQKQRVAMQTGDESYGSASMDEIEGIGELGMAFEEEEKNEEN